MFQYFKMHFRILPFARSPPLNLVSLIQGHFVSILKSNVWTDSPSLSSFFRESWVLFYLEMFHALCVFKTCVFKE